MPNVRTPCLHFVRFTVLILYGKNHFQKIWNIFSFRMVVYNFLSMHPTLCLVGDLKTVWTQSPSELGMLSLGRRLGSVSIFLFFWDRLYSNRKHNLISHVSNRPNLVGKQNRAPEVKYAPPPKKKYVLWKIGKFSLRKKYYFGKRANGKILSMMYSPVVCFPFFILHWKTLSISDVEFLFDDRVSPFTAWLELCIRRGRV